MPSAAASEYTLQEAAALKILLHAAKFPSAAVNGVLLGTVLAAQTDSKAEDSPADATTSTSPSAVTIVDAVPLFHTFLSLSAMLETALVQVASYAKQQGFGLQVIGYYHANANLSDKDLGPTARKVADKIRGKQPAACALLVDNSNLQAFSLRESDDAFQLWLGDSSLGWRRSEGALRVKSGGLSDAYHRQYTARRYRHLHDFDDHLNDISKDWLNDGLLTEA